ncbi:MAG: hypothetical protein HOM11_17110 [Methylococcales bacterium]|jgi:two-component system, NtrC family, sensor kinase|nr:hypothetical protein [Methylococcales bacterium]MBT7410343.1 hypothetical protein [Methylococcales bacterium]
MTEEDTYKKAYEREYQARLLAEKLLDEKTREVFQSMLCLQSSNAQLLTQKNELEMLVTIANLTQQNFIFRDELQHYLTTACTLLQSPYGIVYLLSDDERNAFPGDIIYPNYDDHPDLFSVLIEEPGHFDGSCLPSQFIYNQHAYLWSNEQYKKDSQRYEIFTSLEIEGAIFIPIKRFDKVIAIVECGINTLEAVTESTVENLQTAAKNISVALERRKAQKEKAVNYEKLKYAHDHLKLTQNQLLQSEKMASLGQIAAGVAHEINNPIGFVISNIETLRDYNQVFTQLITEYTALEENLGEPKNNALKPILEKINKLKEEEDVDFIVGDVEQMVEDCCSGLKRVKDIISDLKQFAHQDDGAMSLGDIHECIDQSLKIVWNELKYNVNVEKAYGELPKIWFNSGQLSQVFINLFVNASHAIKDKGNININTQIDGDMVLIQVKDDGIGVPESLLNKIFDPFFTTKSVGEGTGLGLSVSFGIIEKHGGDINIESVVNEGATFSIHLPIKQPDTSQ